LEEARRFLHNARMRRSEKRILATHAGSLPRPARLVALHAARFAGEEVDDALLEETIERATEEVIARQIEVGLDVVNNGEVGRESFFTYLQHRMSGFGGASTRPIMADLTRYPGVLERLVRRAVGEQSVSLLAAPKAIGDVAYVTNAPIERECAQLRRCLDAAEDRYVEAFVSSPSPGIVATAMQNEHYPSLEAYVSAVAAALRVEYRAIVDEGFLLQIDAPDLAMERHTLFQDKPLDDFLAFVDVVVAAINRSLRGIPRDRVRLHVCWGNYEGPHDLDVPLEDIWARVSAVEAGAVLLSMANPRHAHEYRCFERLPLGHDLIIVPGVIDTTTNYVEHPRAVADRIERVARAVGDPTRVIAGTDCGFETSAGFGSVAPDVVWAKLKALAEGAAIASERLFGSR
jgi:5-methyltetrahydropteroyltriglutamate--homocysteine methyltransferase